MGWLQERLQRILIPTPDLEALRPVLIQAGQLEQALADAPSTPAGSASPRLSRFQKITDLLANAFVTLVAAKGSGDPGPGECVRRAAHALRKELKDTDSSLQCQLTLKVPEGFEFYVLFPEQYWQATLAWLADHNSICRTPLLVVGVRGIGTTLSAVVSATLQRAAWPVQRLTVRPSGHPYARNVTLQPTQLSDAQLALVVDEGPGLSGSSMAAVAQALAECGLHPGSISFLPSHSGEPGPAASEQTRRWWATVPRYTSTLEGLRWGGLDLPTVLRDEALRLTGSRELVEPVHNVGAGCWREDAYPDASRWPTAIPRFERAKYLCACSNGTRVLWKFAGLGAWVDVNQTAAEGALASLAQLAKEGRVPQPLGLRQGFVALPWMDGERLNPSDAANPAVLQRVAQYVVEVAESALTTWAQKCAQERLRLMTFQNLSEAFEPEVGERAGQVLCNLGRDQSEASYGDGHLAPWEWIRTASGQLLKTDSFGHNADHTAIGKQSVLWDVAGFIVEWGLTAPERARWITALHRAGLNPDRAALAGYELAYAAFRLGLATLSLELEPAQSPEHPRLAQAVAQYRHAALARVLPS
jgi:hypothetical protein